MRSLPKALAAPLSSTVGLLLESRIPARIAWVADNGEPRVVPIWFDWSGEELLMATFAGAKKLDDIVDGTIVAVTIDDEAFPYRSLKLRGPVVVEPVEGIAECYQRAATRYLGDGTGEKWLAFLGEAQQVVLRLRPTWAIVADMAVDSPFLKA